MLISSELGALVTADGEWVLAFCADQEKKRSICLISKDLRYSGSRELTHIGLFAPLLGCPMRCGDFRRVNISERTSTDQVLDPENSSCLDHVVQQLPVILINLSSSAKLGLLYAFAILEFKASCLL